MNLNKCQFVGNLTRDPELKVLNSGTRVVNFGLAVNRNYKKADGQQAKETSFLEFEAWDTAADTLMKYLRKGAPLFVVDSSVKTDSWEDKTSGEKRSRLKFRLNEFRLMPGYEYTKDEKSDNPANEDENLPF